MAWLTDLQAGIALAALAVLEISLGIVHFRWEEKRFLI
jgi:hypothetical protein